VFARLAAEFERENVKARLRIYLGSTALGLICFMPLMLLALPDYLPELGSRRNWVMAAAIALPTLLWAWLVGSLFRAKVEEARHAMGFALAHSDMLLLFMLEELPDSESELKLPQPRNYWTRTLSRAPYDHSSMAARLRALVSQTQTHDRIRLIDIDSRTTANAKNLLTAGCCLAWLLPIGPFKLVGVLCYSLIDMFEHARLAGMRLALIDYFTTEDFATLG
jgi:hypothetical protein